MSLQQNLNIERKIFIKTLSDTIFVFERKSLRVNGVEMVRFASSPEGGYLSKGIAKVGVRTSCVPGGKTRRFSCVIHKNRFWRWWLLLIVSSSLDLEVKDEQVHNEIINSRNHIIWEEEEEKNGKIFLTDFTLLNDHRAN